MIPIAKPIVGREEEREVLKVLRSGAIAQGKWVEKFEQEFAKFVGAKFAVATSNGTTALHTALLSLGITQGDEVITTPFSFIASANSILYVGAKPIFVDIESTTFNINPDLIEAKITSKTKAILVVHLFGLPANMPKIIKIARKHKLLVIEDACQAHGAEVEGKHVGSIGDVACFSFYPTKNMTTGEGGMLTTNKSTIAKKALLYRNHGMQIRYHHGVLGYNYRLTNIGGAIGLVQLKKLVKLNKKRKINAEELTRGLAKKEGLITPISPKGFKHVFHQYTVRVTSRFPISRDKLVEKLYKNGIASSIFYPIPIHLQKPYLKFGYKGKLRVTEKIAKQVLSIPVHPSLTTKDLAKIVTTICEV